MRGRVQLSFRAQVGEIAVHIAAPGDSFPLAALLGPGALITGGRALSDVDALALPTDKLLDLCENDPEIGLRLYRAAAQVFANRFSITLAHLGASAGKGLREVEE